MIQQARTVRSGALPIDYEAEREDAIADVVGRLDEIGDLIDGGLPTEEATIALLALLAQ